MQLQTTDEKTLRRFLLGDVSPEEREQIELWLMSDDEAYDLLVAEEDDLIDDLLRGKLKGDELDRCNTYFLAAPERQHKLQFGRSFKRYLEGVEREGASAKPFHLWEAIAAFLHYRPALGYAFSALIVLIAVGGIWSVFSVVELQRQFDSASSQLADVSSQSETYRRQLDESRSASESLQAQLQMLERTIADLKPSTPPQMLLALNLNPGLSRSSSSIPKITTTLNTRLVRFSLILLDDNYARYGVVLVDDGGRQLWAVQGLTTSASGKGKALVVSVPGELLSSGDYSFKLSGVSNSQPPESISSYYFRAFRQ